MGIPILQNVISFTEVIRDFKQTLQQAKIDAVYMHAQ